MDFEIQSGRLLDFMIKKPKISKHLLKREFALTEETIETAVVINDPVELMALKVHLNILHENMMDDAFVPDWGDSTHAGLLAEQDSEIIRLAGKVVSRLLANVKLHQKYPGHTVYDNYVNFDPEGNNNGSAEE
jgi:hypothetical protein